MNNIEPLVSIEKEKCSACFACVRSCPVNAILLDDNDLPEVNDSRCIGCGNCVTQCPENVIYYRSSINEVETLLASDKKNVAVVSPSISAEFSDITDYRKFVQMIKELGFDHVHEVSFGVDLIAYKYLDLLNNFKGRYYITSTDPVVVNYIEKYKPNLANNLAPFVSPMVATSIMVREIYGDKANLVYIGPEIARKNEALRYKERVRIDAAITFTELRELFKKFNISEGTLEYSEFDPPLGYKGSLFPINNGLLQAAEMSENLLNKEVFSIEGKQAMIDAINEFESRIEDIKKHFNITYGSSLSGPGMTKNATKTLRETLVIQYANKRLKNFFRFEWNQQLQKYLLFDLSTTFQPDDQRIELPSEEEISKQLEILGKCGNRNGCSSCGYKSCREFAIAVAQGLTKPILCISYIYKNLKNLEQQQEQSENEIKKLKSVINETENTFVKEKNTYESTSGLMKSVLQKLRAGIIIVDKDLKVLLTNQTFIRIVGEDAEEINEVIPGLQGADLTKLLPYDIHNLFSFVLNNGEDIDNRDMNIEDKIINISLFSIKKGEVVAAILRDMSSPEVQKAEVMNRVSDVIDKNLELVQKIGFILGEGAAEIEKELNSIIDFYKK